MTLDGRRGSLAALAMLALGAGCTGEREALELTYTQDVRPILEARCMGCYAEGNIGPFSLTTYEEV